MKIGNKLRVFRTEKGYTQEKIADLLQISQASYSNLENNRWSSNDSKEFSFSIVFSFHFFCSVKRWFFKA